MQLTTCCRCFSLRTGTLVSGALGIILSVITIIIMLVTDHEWKTIVIDILPQWAVKTILIINLCMTILISTLLIVGVYKRNTFLMLPWVILGIMLAVALLISVVYTGVMFLIHKHVLAGALWLVFGVVAIVVYVYMWLVVYSFFQQVRYEKADMRVGPYGRPYNYRRP